MSAEARSTEVRSCAKCGQHSVVLAHDVAHTMFGAATGEQTREYRCQSCGAWFIVRPRGHVVGLWIAGGLLTLLTCVAGLPFLFLAWKRSNVEASIPVVPGAPVPEIRFRSGPPVRSCGKCSAAAVATRVTRHTHNGVPTGTEYEYQCTTCGAEFVIESPWGMTMSVLGGLLLGGVAAAFVLAATSPGWRWGGGAFAALLSLFLLGQAVVRLSNRLRNPIVEEPQLAIR